MQIVDLHAIKLRVYERGAGETLACGTGACAAVVAGIRRGLLDSPVQVHTHGGRLTVAWDGHSLRMSGPASTVFSGQVDIDALTEQFTAQLTRSEEHTSELQSLMRISYAVFCLKKKKKQHRIKKNRN